MHTVRKWVDIFSITKDAIIVFFNEFVSLVRNYEDLPSITEQAADCLTCGWSGTVWDCEPDADGEGSLGCPECLEIIEVTIG